MTLPTVLHPPAVAVQDPLLTPHQVQVEAGPGVEGVDLPDPQTGGRGGPGQGPQRESLVTSAEVDAAPRVPLAGPGELPSLGLALSAGHEGVDHHLVTGHHTAVVTASLGEMCPHPLTELRTKISQLSDNVQPGSVTVTWSCWSVLVSDPAASRDCYQADPLSPFIVITACMNQLNSVLLFTKHAIAWLRTVQPTPQHAPRHKLRE